MTFRYTFYCLIVAVSVQSYVMAGTINEEKKFRVAVNIESTRSQTKPSMAYDGKGTYLIVWQQGRNYFETETADIYASLLKEEKEGMQVKKTFNLYHSDQSQESPAVVFSNGIFLVVWQDFGNGNDWDVYGCRIDTDGSVLDREPVIIANGTGNQALPAISAGKSGFLVVWQDFSDKGFYRLACAKVNFNGKVNVFGPIVHNGKYLYGGQISIGSINDIIFLTWDDEKDWGRSGDDRITRRFARLVLQHDSLKVLEITASPTKYFQDYPGIFAGDGNRSLLYTTWVTGGRGFFRPFRLAVACLFHENSSTPLLNINNEISPGLGGWDVKKITGLNVIKLPIDGPVSASFGHDIYACVARSSVYFKDKKFLLYGIRLKPDGRKVDSSNQLCVLHESDHILANPIIAADKNGWLLVFEEDNSKGIHELWAKGINFP